MEAESMRARSETAEDELSAIAHHLDCEVDSDSILHVIREIQADLKIYTERATAAEAENDRVRAWANDIQKGYIASKGQIDGYALSIFVKAEASRLKAQSKFPQPNYIALKVAEEAGEVVRAAVHYAENRLTWEELEGEAVQTIAMLMRLLIEGDEVNGVIPPARAAVKGGAA